MPNAREISWLRIVAEGMAIVASILLAFAIDAWWDDTVESKREREILEALLDDFQISRARIVEWRNFHVVVKNSANTLLQVATSSGRDLDDSEIDRLLVDLSWFGLGSLFTTGALNSIISGGELSIIKDDELRQRLADWPSRIERVASFEQQQRDFHDRVWLSYFQENGYLPKLAILDVPMPGRPSQRNDPIDLELATSTKHSEMIASEEFHNLLVRKYWVHIDMVHVYEAAIAALDRTNDRIAMQLR